MHFVNEKFHILIKIPLKFVPTGWNDNNTSNSLDNRLASNRWQAITWTNAGPTRWRMYVALGGMS